MNTKKNKKAGFTLVELMVVAIIVAILAAVAIPLMSGNKERAMGTEAEAAMGTIVTALRVYRAEFNDYPTAGAATTIPGIDAGSLDGTYFDTGNYSFVLDATGYKITCAGGDDSGRGNGKGLMTGKTLTLDGNGDITR